MIKPKQKNFISPESIFVNGCEDTNFSIGNFWQWAYSDLQQNNIRGILAEFIVAKALNITLSVRDTWDDYDLKTPDSIKIEIKSGAYLQSLEQAELSNIVFTGLCGQAWDAENGCRGGDAQFRADIYIFAVQTSKTHDEFNQLDLTQWEFYLLPQKELKNRGAKSISLTALKKLVEPVDFSGLGRSVNYLQLKIAV
ncbi:MAG: hypothetical protein IH585_01295 [Anaerolineaceae bacterium]|nr:hypothetical protein [Anaerolineaceae bacterium]